MHRNPEAPRAGTRRRRARILAGAVLVLAAAVAGVGRGLMRDAGVSPLVFGPPLLIALVLFAAAGGLGGLCLRWFGFPSDRRLETQVVATALGLGIQGWLLAALGLFGLLNRPTVLAVLAAGLLALVCLRRPQRRASAAGERPRIGRRRGRLFLAAALLLAAGLAMAFVASLTPPVSYDVLEYHLPVAREWVRTSRVGLVPHNFYSQLPFGVETLYAGGLLLEHGADATPKLINFGLMVLSCLAVAALAVRLRAPAGLAALAAAHFAVHPTVVRIYSDAFADMGAALFAAASALSLLAAPGRAPRRRALLGGLLGGFALSAKTTAAGIYLLPALVFLAAANRPAEGEPGTRIGWWRQGASCLLFLAGAAIGFCPWPVRNWIATGNPAAPFLNAWFGGNAWQLDTERFWLSMHGWSAPLSTAYLNALGGRIGLIGWPWALGSLAASIACPRPARRLALTAAAGYAVYCLLTGAADRFAAPIILFGIVLAHVAVARILRPSSAPRRWASILLVLAALGPLWAAARNMAACGAIEYAACATSREDCLSRMLGAPPAEMFRAANDKCGPAPRILCLYDARSYLLQPPCVANSVFDKSPLLEALRRCRPGESLAARLRSEGFTHVLVNEWELARLIATHATPAVRAEPQYTQILSLPDQRRRFEALAAHPEWYAPYSRERATPDELRQMAQLLDSAAAQPIFIQRLGAIRMLVAPIPAK